MSSESQMKVWKEEPEAPEGPTVEEISGWLQQEQARFERLALEYGKVKERLEGVEQVYRKMYKKWWMRLLFLPFDPVLEGRQLMRCKTCGMLFWEEGPEEYTTHKGHRYGMATGGTWWDGLALKLGRIK